MQIRDEKLLSEFRRGPCEWCHAPGATDPHHLFTRGMGGGGRLDIRLNLCRLCHRCHMAHHYGSRPMTPDLLAIVASREVVLQNEIEVYIGLLRRWPKDAMPPEPPVGRPRLHRDLAGSERGRSFNGVEADAEGWYDL